MCFRGGLGSKTTSGGRPEKTETGQMLDARSTEKGLCKEFVSRWVKSQKKFKEEISRNDFNRADWDVTPQST